MSNQEAARDEGVLVFFKTYWFVIVFIGSMVFTWSTMINNINNLNSRVSRLEVSQEQTQATLFEIQKGLVEIQTSLEFIKVKVSPQ